MELQFYMVYKALTWRIIYIKSNLPINHLWLYVNFALNRNSLPMKEYYNIILYSIDEKDCTSFLYCIHIKSKSVISVWVASCLTRLQLFSPWHLVISRQLYTINKYIHHLKCFLQFKLYPQEVAKLGLA